MSSIPLRPGSCVSSNMTPGMTVPALRSCKASLPSSAVWTMWPCRVRRVAMTSRLTRSSSITRTIGSSCFSPMPSMFPCLYGTVLPLILLIRDGDLVQPARRLEQLARAGAVGRFDDSVALHQVNEVRRAAIGNSNAALQKRCRGFSKFKDQTYCVVEHRIVLFFIATIALEVVLAVFFGRLEE